MTGALAGLPKPYLTSLYESWRRAESFSALRAYCMFVGYPRSGHSLVGSLLDAHPDVVIAHELDALKYVRARFRREQLFHLLLGKSEEFTARGRQWNGYSYEVPGQWQGRRRSLRVIGDKKGGGSTMRLRADPGLLTRLRRTVGVPVKLVHVVRNPFDNISTIVLKTKRRRFTLEEGIDYYFALCETVERLRRATDRADLYELRHEEFVAGPRRKLAELCGFLGVDAPDDYLDACASVVFDSPRRTRRELEWTPALVGEVRGRMSAYSFLRGYDYTE
jgi:hypothetical protein